MDLQPRFHNRRPGQSWTGSPSSATPCRSLNPRRQNLAPEVCDLLISTSRAHRGDPAEVAISDVCDAKQPWSPLLSKHHRRDALLPSPDPQILILVSLRRNLIVGTRQDDAGQFATLLHTRSEWITEQLVASVKRTRTSSGRQSDLSEGSRRTPTGTMKSRILSLHVGDPHAEIVHELVRQGDLYLCHPFRNVHVIPDVDVRYHLVSVDLEA